MKLVILLSIAALAACDYSGPQPEIQSERPEAIEESATIAPGKSYLNFKNFYQGAFPPARFPSANFLPSTFSSFGYPLRAFNYASPPQSILPPISQIIPPQVSQIVPPIVPPILGNVKPSLPAPSLGSSQFFPPVTKPLLNKFTSPFSSYSFPYYQFPYSFPSTFSFPPTTFSFPTAQKQPAKTQTETLSTSYGPPASGPVEPEPSGQAESSAAFEPAPVSFPYEPAAPEEPEPAAPPKPAQEYGLPPSN